MLRPFHIFNFSILLHAGMWLLFLVAFFSFFCVKSNLVPDNPRQISPKLITQANLVFTSGQIYMFLLRKLSSVSNLLWFSSFQWSPGLVFVRLQLCDVIYLLCRLGVCPSLHRIFFVGFRAEAFLCFPCPGSTDYDEFRPFALFSSQFSRWRVTFADCNIPSEIIKLQGALQSNAYLVYLELYQQQKQRAATEACVS